MMATRVFPILLALIIALQGSASAGTEYIFIYNEKATSRDGEDPSMKYILDFLNSKPVIGDIITVFGASQKSPSGRIVFPDTLTDLNDSIRSQVISVEWNKIIRDAREQQSAKQVSLYSLTMTLSDYIQTSDSKNIIVTMLNMSTPLLATKASDFSNPNSLHHLPNTLRAKLCGIMVNTIDLDNIDKHDHLTAKSKLWDDYAQFTGSTIGQTSSSRQSFSKIGNLAISDRENNCRRKIDQDNPPPSMVSAEKLTGYVMVELSWDNRGCDLDLKITRGNESLFYGNPSTSFGEFYKQPMSGKEIMRISSEALKGDFEIVHANGPPPSNAKLTIKRQDGTVVQERYINNFTKFSSYSKPVSVILLDLYKTT